MYLAETNCDLISVNKIQSGKSSYPITKGQLISIGIHLYNYVYNCAFNSDNSIYEKKMCYFSGLYLQPWTQIN